MRPFLGHMWQSWGTYEALLGPFGHILGTYEVPLGDIWGTGTFGGFLRAQNTLNNFHYETFTCLRLWGTSQIDYSNNAKDDCENIC